MIGLCGAHRTGKTTLARAFAKKKGLAFVETSASSVFKDMGLDPAQRYPFDVRLSVQEEILRRFDKEYACHNKATSAVTDRTPLDLAAYTLGDAVQDHVGEELQERFAKYIKSCIDVTNRRFSLLLIVQPGIQIVAADGKATPNAAYIEHLNSLVLGLSADERMKVTHFYIPRHMTSIDDRVSALDFALQRTIERTKLERESHVIH